jgi:predicted metalloendopeptidase
MHRCDRRRFHGAQALGGQQEQKPRWKRAMPWIESALGECVGELCGARSNLSRRRAASPCTMQRRRCIVCGACRYRYVARHFKAEAKTRALGTVERVRAALEKRLGEVAWMTEGTRAKAREKSAASSCVGRRVFGAPSPHVAGAREDGALQRQDRVRYIIEPSTVSHHCIMPERRYRYPDKWVDYSSLEIVAGDHLGNIFRARAFEHARQMGRGRTIELGEIELGPGARAHERRRLRRITCAECRYRYADAPTDRSRWLMLPQQINAYYHPNLVR